MERVRVKFTPSFEPVLCGWAVNYTSKHIWRVGRDHEFDDLMQDAFLIFLKCCENYPDVVDEPQFTSLFQAAFINHIHHLSNVRTQRREVSSQSDEGDDPIDFFDSMPAKVSSDILEHVEFRILLDDAPAELRCAILGALADGSLLEKIGSSRETTDEFLRRHAGIMRDGKYRDITTAIRALLKGSPICT